MEIYNHPSLSCGRHPVASMVIEYGQGKVQFVKQQGRSGKWIMLSIEEEHSISADGKTLSIVHSERWEDKGEKWPNSMVFDKQIADAEDDQDKRKTVDSGLFFKQQLIR